MQVSKGDRRSPAPAKADRAIAQGVCVPRAICTLWSASCSLGEAHLVGVVVAVSRDRHAGLRLPPAGMIRVGASAFPYDRKRFNHVHMISLVKRRTAFDCGPIDPPGGNDEMCPKDKPKNTSRASRWRIASAPLWATGVSFRGQTRLRIYSWLHQPVSIDDQDGQTAICSSAHGRQARTKAATSLGIVDALF